MPAEHIKELEKRLSAQKGINVEFEKISEANHFFSKSDQGLTKSLNKYIKKNPHYIKNFSLSPHRCLV